MSQHSTESGYISDEAQLRSPSNNVIKTDNEIFTKTFEVLEKLVDSQNGTLYTGYERKTGRKVVIKQIPRRSISEYKIIDGRMVPSEIFYHMASFQICRDAVVEPLAWFEKRSSFVLVMEKPEDMIDLYDFTEKYGIINEEVAKIIIKDIVEINQKLINHGICHRDLKDENILINPYTLNVKIIDFGCSTKVKSNYINCQGTPEYWPSEWYEQHSYQPRNLTVWSIGSLMYILLTGSWEFENGKHKRDLEAEEKISQNAKNLINSMFCSVPTKRATFEEILASDWLAC